MNSTKLLAITTLAIASVGLTACQTSPMREMRGEKGHHERYRTGEGMYQSMKKMHDLSPEQRQRMEQRRAQRQALDQACAGKADQTIQVNVAGKVMQGKCETVFHPDRHVMRSDRAINPPMPESSRLDLPEITPAPIASSP